MKFKPNFCHGKVTQYAVQKRYVLGEGVQVELIHKFLTSNEIMTWLIPLADLQFFPTEFTHWRNNLINETTRNRRTHTHTHIHIWAKICTILLHQHLPYLLPPFFGGLGFTNILTKSDLPVPSKLWWIQLGFPADLWSWLTGICE